MRFDRATAVAVIYDHTRQSSDILNGPINDSVCNCFYTQMSTNRVRKFHPNALDNRVGSENLVRRSWSLPEHFENILRGEENICNNFVTARLFQVSSRDFLERKRIYGLVPR